MSSLQVFLFGNMQIVNNNCSPVSLPPATQALAAYLILNRNRCYQREILADQFWEAYSGSKARNCLSSTLWRLRRLLEPEGTPRGTYLLTTPTGAGEIGFNQSSHYWLDVEVFEQAARPLIAHPTDLTLEGAQELEQTLALYRGDLLDGMYQEWVLRERERLRQIYLDSLNCLMSFYLQEQEYERSLAFGKQILALEPLREDVHRTVIEAHWFAGNRSSAIQQYEECCKLLANELGIDPMIETRRLYRKIVSEPPAGKIPSSIPTDFALHSPTTMDQAMKQLSLAMRMLEQAEMQLQHAIKMVQHHFQSHQ